MDILLSLLIASVLPDALDAWARLWRRQRALLPIQLFRNPTLFSVTRD